mmetsp:Transcript_18970/g.71806  ORF Transcript_18970/g.71806 Transcript_18970/m.71806 type:complete len:213 (+) Transcript_18970:1337-1975(+)
MPDWSLLLWESNLSCCTSSSTAHSRSSSKSPKEPPSRIRESSSAFSCVAERMGESCRTSMPNHCDGAIVLSSPSCRSEVDKRKLVVRPVLRPAGCVDCPALAASRSFVRSSSSLTLDPKNRVPESSTVRILPRSRASWMRLRTSWCRNLRERRSTTTGCVASLCDTMNCRHAQQIPISMPPLMPTSRMARKVTTKTAYSCWMSLYCASQSHS